MIVTIVEYDSIKGKGRYKDRWGNIVPFSYKDFCGEQAIPVGSKAKLRGRMLCPNYSLWFHIKEVVNGYRGK